MKRKEKKRKKKKTLVVLSGWRTKIKEEEERGQMVASPSQLRFQLVSVPHLDSPHLSYLHF
jgi:hypothetical protein